MIPVRRPAAPQSISHSAAGLHLAFIAMPQIYDELPFEIDHVIAEQHGGKTVASNLTLACFADVS
jgi:HNH endonuclease